MVRVIETTRLGQVTGAASANRTDQRFAVVATDLGIMWDGGDGRVLVLFGDTYGEGWCGNGAGPGSADWRKNVLAFSSGTELAEGLRLDSVIAREDGGAAQVIASGQGKEVTVIPNSGVTVEGLHYVHYMSVRQWGPPGTWRTNYAGVAVSADGGTTWKKPRSARWGNRWRAENRFQLGAFAASGEHVYLFGTTNGRYGDGYLARALPGNLLDTGEYEYWTGSEWGRRQSAAVPVFEGPVGEMSVGYHRLLDRWLLMHLDERREGIVLRSAPELTGPWTWGEVVVSGREFPAIYGGFLHPWSMDSEHVYYLVSQWGPYNVFLTRSTIAP
ncbi:hypothetical protein BAY61_27080 [Prauserella marina]|uniref:Uncharacterized protein n=1 Tax=Prauserella marina TaxID=530584 RepID=A0A222VVT2_9PSEU|nr:DUF4185 domain-containing protein [Prauserella marina]ASR38066.1 hypothetical protein BAY61_27080 [Prauserella marina]PWV73310.1 uncharacterized protein DUF4185 [Prauserella marina]SDD66687.1 protein of unknown function [Prauserella marina]